MDDNGNVQIVDFSFSPEPKRFTVNGDVFECSPELPLTVMLTAANIKMDMESFKTQGLEPILTFFDEVFIGDSSQRFRARVNDKERPIGLRHIMKILPWLMEVYGLRPTEESESSLPLPVNTGTISTAGLLPEVSTSSDSSSPAS